MSCILFFSFAEAESLSKIKITTFELHILNPSLLNILYQYSESELPLKEHKPKSVFNHCVTKNYKQSQMLF